MLGHLLELRKRALGVFFIFILFFFLFFFFANDLFHLLITPLLRVLPQQNQLIATEITSPVLIPIQLACDTAMLCTTPFALLQLWRFAAPGLYKQERSSLGFAMISSLFLFCLGILFCFYLVLPPMLHFFAKAVPLGVQFMPDMSYALSFIMRTLLLFGLCFQIPLICMTLVRIKWMTVQGLKQIRSYVIVVAFIVSMLLTPPDVLSQLMLAIPLCLLYEAGIVMATFLVRQKAPV